MRLIRKHDWISPANIPTLSLCVAPKLRRDSQATRNRRHHAICTPGRWLERLLRVADRCPFRHPAFSAAQLSRCAGRAASRRQTAPHADGAARQLVLRPAYAGTRTLLGGIERPLRTRNADCLLYTSDAADDLLCVDLGGR